MRLKIDRLNHTGDGIGIENNIVFFVPKTIPGDIIEIEEKDIIHHKNYNEITNYKLIEKSINRLEPQCPYYNECGGCQLLNLAYENQLKYKKEKVIEIFKRYTNTNINPTIIPSPQYNYRNKITFQVKNGILGLFSERTNNIIPINKCLLIPDKINNIIPLLKKLNLTNVNQIIVKTMQNQTMIQIIGKINPKEVIEILNGNINSIYINDKLLLGQPNLKEILDPYQFKVSPNSFFQINHIGTINLYNKIKEYLGNNNKEVLDLYCGTGTIGIYVSEKCQHITGIEINQSSVNDAKENIKINNIKNIDIIKGSVEELLKNNKKYDAIIVDPPRSGLHKKASSTLLKIKTPKLIYISCNPITLARDFNILKEEYTLQEISLIDMFPNTYHCESIAVLERR